VHFGSLEKLRSAKVDQLTQVEGIGKLTAERLVEFLNA
jgi:excinuclease UvrABC nuclease subunit